MKPVGPREERRGYLDNYEGDLFTHLGGCCSVTGQTWHCCHHHHHHLHHHYHHHHHHDHCSLFRAGLRIGSLVTVTDFLTWLLLPPPRWYVCTCVGKLNVSKSVQMRQGAPSLDSPPKPERRLTKSSRGARGTYDMLFDQVYSVVYTYHRPKAVTD